MLISQAYAVPRPGTSIPPQKSSANYPDIQLNMAKTTNDFNRGQNTGLDEIFQEERNQNLRPGSRRSNSRLIASNTVTASKTPQHDNKVSIRLEDQRKFDTNDDPDPFEDDGGYFGAGANQYRNKDNFGNQRNMRQTNIQSSDQIYKNELMESAQFGNPDKAQILQSIPVYTADGKQTQMLMETVKTQELQKQIDGLSLELKQLRRAKEQTMMDGEKQKGILEAENKALALQVQELKTNLKQNKDREAEMMQSKDSNYKSQIAIIEDRNKELLAQLREDHKMEVQNLKKNYDQMLQNLKDQNSKLDAQIRQKTANEVQLNSKLLDLEAKMDNLVTNTGKPDEYARDEIAQQLKSVTNMLTSAKAKEDSIIQKEKQAQAALEHEMRKLRDKERDIEDKLAEYKQSNIDLTNQTDQMRRDYAEKEKSLKEREKDLEYRYERIRVDEQRINLAKQSIDDRENELERKTQSQMRELMRIRDEIDSRDFDSKKKFKDITERERDLAWREDSANTKLQNLKIKEEQISQQQKEITEIATKLRQEQLEITDFRNNFANKERRLREDREKLNALELMINSQMDKLDRDKKDAESAKKTLNSLRADYVRDLKGQLRREDFMNQDIKFTPYTTEQSLKLHEDLVDKAKRKEETKRNAEMSVGAFARERFDLERFISEVKAKLV